MKRKAEDELPLEEVPSLPLVLPQLLNKKWWLVGLNLHCETLIIREWNPMSAKDPMAAAHAMMKAFTTSRKEKHKLHFARVMRWLDDDDDEEDEDEDATMVPYSFAGIRRQDVGVFERLVKDEDTGCLLHDGPTFFFTDFDYEQ